MAENPPENIPNRLVLLSFLKTDSHNSDSGWACTMSSSDLAHCPITDRSPYALFCTGDWLYRGRI